MKAERLKSLIKIRIDDMQLKDPEEIVRDIKKEHPLTTKNEEDALLIAYNLLNTKAMKGAVAEQFNFVDFAEGFIEQFPLYFDRSKIWWMWKPNGGWWDIRDDVDVTNAVYDAIQDSGITSQSVKSKYLTALQMASRKNEPEELPRTWIQFKDCVVDLEREGQTFQASPEYFFTNPIPWSFIGGVEETPMMDRLFEEWVGPEQKQMLYEICAYCLMPSYPIHRIFCLLGPGSNGKSSFQKLLHRFVGFSNVTSTDLDRLADSRFEVAKMYKKLVVEIGETDFSVLENTSFIKRLTGEDLVSGEFKNKPAFDFQNYAKIIVATNSLPMTTDKTEGFYRRWVIVDFPNRFDGNQDVVAEIPEEEFSALARRSVRVLVGLLKDRKFAGEGTVEERMNRYEEKSNPLKKFVEERLVKGDINEDRIWLWQFNEMFESYLKENGFRVIRQRETKSKLIDMGFELDTIYTKKSDGSDTRWVAILGYRWKVKEVKQHEQHEKHGSLLHFSRIENEVGPHVIDVGHVGKERCCSCQEWFPKSEMIELPDRFDPRATTFTCQGCQDKVFGGDAAYSENKQER